MYKITTIDQNSLLIFAGLGITMIALSVNIRLLSQDDGKAKIEDTVPFKMAILMGRAGICFVFAAFFNLLSSFLLANSIDKLGTASYNLSFILVLLSIMIILWRLIKDILIFIYAWYLGRQI